MEPDAWTRIGKAAQRREKQEWAIEKPKLEHARDLRRIYSIDPSDEEYKDITKNARRKLKTPKAAAMPCKKGVSSSIHTGNRCFKNRKKPRHLEAHESTRQRVESVTKRMHEEHVAGKGHHSVLHYNLVHKFIPMPQAMKIPDAKAAVDKELKKLETIPAWDVEKIKSKKEGKKKAEKNNNKVHFASLMDLCHRKNSELEPQFQKYKGRRVVLRGDIVKDDSGANAVFSEQGSSASQMTAAKVVDVIARLPDCDGQAADAISAYTQVKMEDAQILL